MTDHGSACLCPGCREMNTEWAAQRERAQLKADRQKSRRKAHDDAIDAILEVLGG